VSNTIRRGRLEPPLNKDKALTPGSGAAKLRLPVRQFKKVLVANRGEIAVRIIRALRELGIRSVAVYSKEDKNSLHVQLADQRICIGEDSPNSYFNKERIVTSALIFEADAVHPGYGFLSENADFARLCAKNSITFIGPQADILENISNKSNTHQISEKNIENMRHIEVQIIADNYGNVVSFGERDCTIRLRHGHNKLLAESPSPAVNSAMRKALGEAAVIAAKELGYVNAGTAEFVLDAEGQHYFTKIKPCIQTEHGVTEIATGIDLVAEQIRVAAGEVLSFTGKNVKITGHSIGCRIYAELSGNSVARHIHLPAGNGIRVDTVLYTGYSVPSDYADYDNMIANVLVHAPTRERAIAKMRSALDETVILGVKTNLDFLFQITREPEFCAGRFDSSFINNSY